MNAKQLVNRKNETNLSNLDESNCPDCGSHTLIEDFHRGELICSYCGAVIERMALNFQQDRRAFTAEEIETRAHNGSPFTPLTDISWMTVIRSSNKITNTRLNRAIKLNHHYTWEKRNLLIAMSEIKRVCTNLSLPVIVAETAAILYKKIQKMNVFRGRSINAFVGACLYLSSRINKVPRSLTDVHVEMATISEREMMISCRFLINYLKIKLPRISAILMLSRYTNILSISQVSTIYAKNLIKEFETRTNTTGKDPKGIIGAAIYVACKETGEFRGKTKITNVCGINECTLRSRIREFEQMTH